MCKCQATCARRLIRLPDLVANSNYAAVHDVKRANPGSLAFLSSSSMYFAVVASQPCASRVAVCETLGTASHNQLRFLGGSNVCARYVCGLIRFCIISSIHANRSKRARCRAVHASYDRRIATLRRARCADALAICNVNLVGAVHQEPGAS